MKGDSKGEEERGERNEGEWREQRREDKHLSRHTMSRVFLFPNTLYAVLTSSTLTLRKDRSKHSTITV